MNKEITKKDTELSRQDQDKINAFSMTYRKFKEIKKDVQLRSKELQTLQDAKSLVEEAMGDPVRVMIGETFLESDQDFAYDYIDKKAARIKKQIENMEKVMQDYQKKIKQLKSHLYAKFGKSINLDQ